MTDWFVRPNTSHSGTRTGGSYANAYGGWAEIQWGAGKVNTGDTLYVCGVHSYASVIEPGAAGVTIRGDYATEAGSIAFTGANYFNLNKNSTTFQTLTFTSENRCIMPGAITITGFTLKNCILNHSSLPAVEFRANAGGNWTNTVIDGNIFNGSSGGGAAIYWSPQTAITTFHENLKITNNAFNGCSSAQGVIVLLSTPAAASSVHIYDLEVSRNTFTNCGGTAIKAYVPIAGQNKGVKIYENVITNQLRVGDLGGGIVVGGFAQSTTTNFGPNLIEKNEAYGLQGTTGFANIMYGSYIVRYNYAKDISSVIYDGCGLLFDLGSDECTAYSNYFENLSGPADFTAGAGIGIIYSATNITCYGNVIKNAYMGVFYGNQDTGRVTNIFNNTFIDCVLAGIHGNPTTYPSDSNYCKNNIFTAKTGTAKNIRYDSGTWNRESSNVFYGFAAGTQTLHASTLTVDPKLDVNHRPQAESIKRTGAYLGGKDFYGKHFYNPPNIGAVDDHTTPAWDSVVRHAI